MNEMIGAERWAGAWKQQCVTDAQHQVAEADLTLWKAGRPHKSFDAFKAIVSRMNPPPKRFLEIGCAMGYYKEVLDICCPGTQYVGMDIAPQQIWLAQKLYPDGNFFVGDSADIRIDSGKYTVVCLSAVLQHLEDYRPSIRECRRVSSRWVMIHRVIATRHGDDRAYLHPAYGTLLPEREVKEATLLEFCREAKLELMDSERWGENDEGQFNASYLFRK